MPPPADADAGEPRACVNEFGAASSPGGESGSRSPHGVASNQWWRKGGRHLDQSELWLMNLDGAPDTWPSGPAGAREVWPMWSGDGRSIYYVSDRGGS